MTEEEIDHIMRTGASLLSEAGDTEYDRAIVEMACRLIGVDVDDYRGLVRASMRKVYR